MTATRTATPIKDKRSWSRLLARYIARYMLKLVLVLILAFGSSSVSRAQTQPPSRSDDQVEVQPIIGISTRLLSGVYPAHTLDGGVFIANRDGLKATLSGRAVLVGSQMRSPSLTAKLERKQGNNSFALEAKTLSGIRWAERLRVSAITTVQMSSIASLTLDAVVVQPLVKDIEDLTIDGGAELRFDLAKLNQTDDHQQSASQMAVSLPDVPTAQNPMSGMVTTGIGNSATSTNLVTIRCRSAKAGMGRGFSSYGEVLGECGIGHQWQRDALATSLEVSGAWYGPLASDAMTDASGELDFAIAPSIRAQISNVLANNLKLTLAAETQLFLGQNQPAPQGDNGMDDGDEECVDIPGVPCECVDVPGRPCEDPVDDTGNDSGDDTVGREEDLLAQRFPERFHTNTKLSGTAAFRFDQSADVKLAASLAHELSDKVVWKPKGSVELAFHPFDDARWKLKGMVESDLSDAFWETTWTAKSEIQLDIHEYFKFRAQHTYRTTFSGDRDHALRRLEQKYTLTPAVRKILGDQGVELPGNLSASAFIRGVWQQTLNEMSPDWDWSLGATIRYRF